MTKPVNTHLQNGGQGVAQIHRADSWDRKFEEATKERGQSLHLILDFDRTITAFKGQASVRKHQWTRWLVSDTFPVCR